MPAGATTSLTVSDFYRIRVEKIAALLKEFVSAATIDLYHRPISLGQPKPTKFPAIMVQPVSWAEELETSAKFDFWGEVGIFVYCKGNEPAAAGQELEKTMAILGRLFSDNAKGDRLTSTPTHQYYVTPGFWIESRFGPVQYSSILTMAREREATFIAAAKAQFRFHDVLIH